MTTTTPTPLPLVEVDSLEIVVILDNELDPFNSSYNPGVQSKGNLRDMGTKPLADAPDRGPGAKEMKMSDYCCGAHGLSLMLTARKGDVKHTLLFDTGPEEFIWERNAKVLGAAIENIEVVHLSHWHRDHSGGMLRAIEMIMDAKKSHPTTPQDLVIDLHPNRPDFRGLLGKVPVSMEADPTFEEMEERGARVHKQDTAHLVLDDMFLISGEIPRVTKYETGIHRGARFIKETQQWVLDELIMDERLVACRVKDKGLVVFSGCSHAGAVNASLHAIDLVGGENYSPFYCLMGGYHLADCDNEKIADTIADLRKLNPSVLMPGHCTGWRAKYRIQDEMPGRLVPSYVGLTYTL